MAEGVLFEFSGDASSVLEALQSIDDALAEIDDLASSVAESLTSMADAMSGALDSAAGSADAASGSLDGLQASIDANSASADALAASVDALQASVDALSASLDTNTASVQANTDALAENAGASDAAGVSAMGASRRIGMIGVVAAAAVVGVLYLGAQGQDALTKVQALAGATDQQMQQYTQGIDQMAEATGQSVASLAGGLYDIVSVGYQGGDALNVLNAAAEAATAGGTDLHTVTNGLTSIMKAFNIQASQASQVTGVLITGVREGKSDFQDYSRAIGLVGLASSTANVNISDSAAALSTLTAIWPSVRMAGQNLQALLLDLSVNTANMASRAQSMGLAFSETALRDAPTITDKLAYLKQVTGGNVDELNKLLGNAGALKAALYLTGDGASQLAQNEAGMAKAAGAVNDAFQTTEKQDLSAHIAKIGGAFSVLTLNITNALTPALAGLADHISTVVGAVANFITQHQNVVMPILAALAALIGGTLVVAIGGLIGGMVAAAGPALAIAAALSAVIGVVTALVSHFGGLGGVLTFFQPIWHTLQEEFSSPQLHAALSGLGEMLQHIGPWITVVGIAIGGTLTIALAVLTGVISGLVGALPGVITFFTGIGNIIGGVARLITDIFTGKFGDILPALKQIGQGILQVFLGPLQAVWGFISGFVTGVISFFQGLFDALVGHSIIPDMINAIVALFTSLPTKLIGVLASAASSLLSGFMANVVTPLNKAFVSLVESAIDMGKTLITNLAQGIINGIPGLKGAADGVKSFLGNIFQGHSPPPGWQEQGQYGPTLIKNFAEGVTAALPQLDRALQGVAAQASAALLPVGQQAAVSATRASAGLVTGSSALGTDTATLRAIQQLSGVIASAVGAGGSGTSHTTYNGGALTLNGVPGPTVERIAKQTISAQGATASAALRRGGGYRRPGYIGPRGV